MQMDDKFRRYSVVFIKRAIHNCFSFEKRDLPIKAGELGDGPSFIGAHFETIRLYLSYDWESCYIDVVVIPKRRYSFKFTNREGNVAGGIDEGVIVRHVDGRGQEVSNCRRESIIKTVEKHAVRCQSNI